MDGLSTTTGIVALAGLALAFVAFACAVIALIRQRRLIAAQRVVLGAHGERDIVAHASELQSGYAALHDYVEDVARRLETRLDTNERGLGGAFTLRGLVRYDAYDELSGHQSTTIALLDSTRSGIVLSSIHHRDQARLYVRRLDRGACDVPLSPEEEQAIELAVSDGNPGLAQPGSA